jgi:hypothetical protein
VYPDVLDLDQFTFTPVHGEHPVVPGNTYRYHEGSNELYRHSPEPDATGDIHLLFDEDTAEVHNPSDTESYHPQTPRRSPSPTPSSPRYHPYNRTPSPVRPYSPLREFYRSIRHHHETLEAHNTILQAHQHYLTQIYQRLEPTPRQDIRQEAATQTDVTAQPDQDVFANHPAPPIQRPNIIRPQREIVPDEVNIYQHPIDPVTSTELVHIHFHARHVRIYRSRSSGEVHRIDFSTTAPRQ